MRFSALIAFLAVATGLLQQSYAEEDVHIGALTDCTGYSDWQAVAIAFSHRVSRQPGRITRVMCCTDEERQRYPKDMLEIMPTYIAPSFAYNPRTKDHYAAYNKPGAVLNWLTHQPPDENWVLLLDSDMLLLHPFHPRSYNLSRGTVMSAPYTYLVGVTNELWKRHIPDIGPRDDTLAGPRGRHADQVGGIFFGRRDDIKSVAPLWLTFTEAVREDPEAWRLTGDQYVKPGGKPWISEMYGYAFGAARAGVWHKWDPSCMLYPGNNVIGIPKIMHYGLLFEVAGYKFDKHWHYDFDVSKCPPWDLNKPGEHNKAGIFAPPPRPSTLTNKDNAPLYYRDLLSIETVATLNAAFCDYHLRHCPPSQQMLDVCTEALDLFVETVTAIEAVEPTFRCGDKHAKCEQWANSGECDRNYEYMKENCGKSCALCSTLAESWPRNQPTETLEALRQLRATLAAQSSPVGATSGAAGTGTDGGTALGTGVVGPTHVTGDQAARQGGADAAPGTGAQNSGGSASQTDSQGASAGNTGGQAGGQITAGGATTSTGAADAADGVNRGLTVGRASGATPKQLYIRCARMALTLAESKECAAAASKGIEWQKLRRAPEGDSTGAAIDLAGGTGARGARGDVRSPAERQAAGRKSRPAGRGGGGVQVGRDLDDLRLLREEVEVVPPRGHRSKGTARGGGVMGGLSTLQAVALWACLLLVLLFAVPRLLRMRRRARSGMRIE